MVLLELLAGSSAVHQQELVVAHIDHGLQPVEAPRGMVERAVARLGVRLRIQELHLPLDSTETDAREARLAALHDLAREEQCRHIVLAHHADDQAETVMMRVVRGSGPAGLRGIARRRGVFLRPLLSFRRAELVAYATEARVEWWEDPANRDPRHLRSWLRTDVMPRMESQLPDLTPRLLQVAAHARRERLAWKQLLSTWPGLGWKEDGAVQSLAIASLREIPDALRGAILGTLARETGCPAGPARLQAAWQVVSSGISGQRADLGSGWTFEIAFDRLRLLPPPVEAAVSTVSLDGSTGSLDWGGWRLEWSADVAPGIQARSASVAWFAPTLLLVRPWRAGDRLRPLGATGRRLAVRCFQDARIPGTARSGWPIIESAGTVAWIPGVCRSDQLLPRPGSSSIRVEVSPRV